MIGLLWGISLLFSYLGQAWGGNDSVGGFGPALAFFGISTLVGIFLFPRTVGIAFTPMFFVTPIAFIVALFRHSLIYAMAILGVGLCAGAAQFIIGKLRPDRAG